MAYKLDYERVSATNERILFILEEKSEHSRPGPARSDPITVGKVLYRSMPPFIEIGGELVLQQCIVCWGRGSAWLVRGV